MGLLKRRIIESEEPKEEPPVAYTVDTDIVESLRYVAKSAKPMDAGQMREAANEIDRLRAEQQKLWRAISDMKAAAETAGLVFRNTDSGPNLVRLTPE